MTRASGVATPSTTSSSLAGQSTRFSTVTVTYPSSVVSIPSASGVSGTSTTTDCSPNPSSVTGSVSTGGSVVTSTVVVVSGGTRSNRLPATVPPSTGLPLPFSTSTATVTRPSRSDTGSPVTVAVSAGFVTSSVVVSTVVSPSRSATVASPTRSPRSSNTRSRRPSGASRNGTRPPARVTPSPSISTVVSTGVSPTFWTHNGISETVSSTEVTGAVSDSSVSASPLGRKTDAVPFATRQTTEPSAATTSRPPGSTPETRVLSPSGPTVTSSSPVSHRSHSVPTAASHRAPTSAAHRRWPPS